MPRNDSPLSLAEFPVIETIAVRFRDLDPLGHVNNAVYATYCEVARIGYFRALTGTSDRRPGIVIAELQLSFRAPAYLDDQIRCGVRIAALGRKSFVMEYLLQRAADEQLLATGSSVQVAYDLAEQRSIWLTDEFRAAVTAFERRDLPRSTAH